MTPVSPRGMAWRPDLARPPMVYPSNIALRKVSSGQTVDKLAHWARSIRRGLLCDSITSGALSFDSGSGTFAVPCEGRLIRTGEITEHRVHGLLKGRVADLLTGIVDLCSMSDFIPLRCGVQTVNILVDGGGAPMWCVKRRRVVSWLVVGRRVCRCGSWRAGSGCGGGPGRGRPGYGVCLGFVCAGSRPG